MKLLLGLIFLATLCSLGQNKITFHQPDYSCIITPEGKDALDIYLTEKELIRSYPEKVTLSDEKQRGLNLKKKLLNEGLVIQQDQSFWTSYKNQLLAIQDIMNKLKLLNKWRFYNYELVYLNTEVENAFTLGGIIFITKGLLDLVKSKNQWAFILAHEMGHNELYHINYTLKREKGFGGLGAVFLAVQQTLLPSFNQFEEWEADVFACDVLNAAGYNLMDAIAFFDVLHKKERKSENEDEFLKKILSSHPLHKERLECLKKHIRTTY